MKFFFDNCISRKLASAMHELVAPDHEVVHLRHRWPEADRLTVPDPVWIARLGAEGGWIIVSGDIRIRSRPVERDALRQARVTAFFLAEGYTKLVLWEQVTWVVHKWPDMVEFAGRFAPGSTFRVPKRGKIETL